MPPDTPAGLPAGPSIRIGHGYDSHRLAPLSSPPSPPAQSAHPQSAHPQSANPMIIGGITFPSDRGPVAHSDGDALMHALTDAILGALGLPDIGQMFPDRDPRWKGAPSETFLDEARRLALQSGWTVGNIDATVILDSPKLGPRKDDIRANLARILRIPAGSINIKGKTHELPPGSPPDPTIEAHAVVLMFRSP